MDMILASSVTEKLKIMASIWPILRCPSLTTSRSSHLRGREKKRKGRWRVAVCPPNSEILQVNHTLGKMKVRYLLFSTAVFYYRRFHKQFLSLKLDFSLSVTRPYIHLCHSIYVYKARQYSIVSLEKLSRAAGKSVVNHLPGPDIYKRCKVLTIHVTGVEPSGKLGKSHHRNRPPLFSPKETPSMNKIAT